MNAQTRSFWITASLLACTLAAANLSERRRPDALAAPLESLPAEIGGWRISGSEALDQKVLRVLLPTSYICRRYGNDSSQVEVFVAFYAMQRAGESMHSPKHCLPGSGWEIWRQDTIRLSAGGRPVQINKLSVQNAGERKLILYWYQSRERVISSEYLGKLLLVRDSILNGRNSGSIARIIVPDTPEGLNAGSTFAGYLIVGLQRCFGR